MSRAPGMRSSRRRDMASRSMSCTIIIVSQRAVDEVAAHGFKGITRRTGGRRTHNGGMRTRLRLGALSAAVIAIACSLASAASAGSRDAGPLYPSGQCAQHTGRYGTLRVCPGAGTVGSVIKVSANTDCGAKRGIDPPHALGLRLVFLGPKAYVGSGGGGVGVPYKLQGRGFRATFRIPSTYTVASNEKIHQVPVTPGHGYEFATYPAAGCEVPFTVRRSS